MATAPGCSTISRSSSPHRSTVTPRRRPCHTSSEESGCTSAFDQGDRDVDHRLEILDRHPFLRAVEVVHAVGEIQAAETTLVEDIRVGGPSREPVTHLVAATLEPV